jgi:spore germination cell wall hydrolase CwlJ-like protein
MKTIFLMLIYMFIASSILGQALTKEQNIVAQTILGEARGDGKGGMYAVACVILERKLSKHWANTAQGVCLQKSQFDYWTQHSRVKWDDQNRANVRRLLQGNSQLAQYAKLLAINLTKLDRSFVKYADHYCTTDTHNYWTKGRKPLGVIGQHKFYKLR